MQSCENGSEPGSCLAGLYSKLRLLLLQSAAPAKEGGNMYRILVPDVPPHRIWLITISIKVECRIWYLYCFVSNLEKSFRQIKKVYKWKRIIWIGNCLNSYIWKMVVFQHLYSLRNMKWAYLKLWGHILSGILFSRNPGKLIKPWIFCGGISIIFHTLWPIS